MKLYTATDLVERYSGKLERTGLAMPCDFTVTIEMFGECLTTITPVLFKENGKTDQLVALYPKTLFWKQDPLYYVFLSEIAAK